VPAEVALGGLDGASEIVAFCIGECTTEGSMFKNRCRSPQEKEKGGGKEYPIKRPQPAPHLPRSQSSHSNFFATCPERVNTACTVFPNMVNSGTMYSCRYDNQITTQALGPSVTNVTLPNLKSDQL
jgi:hypothetical protein